MDSLVVVHEEIAACRRCPRLVAWREQVAVERRAAYRDEEYWGRGVPGFGDPAARLVVVGLAPAAHGANRTGRMFTGDRSGDWLYRALWRAGFANQPEARSIDDGLELRGAYITSPVKCAPPANKPTPTEVATCRPFLERELALLPDARVIVALGHLAYDVVCSHFGIRPKPKFGHGVEVLIPVSGDAPTGVGGPRGAAGASRAAPLHLVCSYHVSQQNTFTGRLTEEMLDAVFTRARELADLPASRSATAQG